MLRYLFLFLVLYPLAFQAQPLQRYEFDAPHMGTTFRLVFYAPNDSLAKWSSDQAFKKIQELNDRLSDYKPDSELNRLSRQSGSSEWIPVSPPLYDIISIGQKVAQQTDGAFDLSVGPYVQVWRKLMRSYKPSLPHPDTLKKISESVGHKYIKLNSKRQAVLLTQPNMQLDPGGIAKGYAADQALEVLQAHGISAALIDAGGDITLGDPPPGKEGWKITIQTFSSEGERKVISLVLANKAIATSGDLYKHITINNKRYSHIIDPRTGKGLTDQSKVTVIAPNGVTADSYASAVSVLGLEHGMQLLTDLTEIEGFFISRQEANIQQHMTDGFDAAVQ